MSLLPRRISLPLVSAQHGLYEFPLRHPGWTGATALALACAGGAVAWRKMRRRPSAEEAERERRALLVRSGRIIDGTILDIAGTVTGQDTGQPGEVGFVLYQYEIGGVEYECSQDVSALRDVVKLEDLRPSFPCSVRYDVRRPENSIVVAENWSGLRTIANAPAAAPAPRQHTPPTSALASP
ncbi:MAG TPA: hypothetical protein VME18_04595 [Acidobacteriaceae bacterium]|nr:hypothetical protein [Acidobacteriaceae bacterium]